MRSPRMSGIVDADETLGWGSRWHLESDARAAGMNRTMGLSRRGRKCSRHTVLGNLNADHASLV